MLIPHTTIELGSGRVWTNSGSKFVAIPPDLRDALAPAVQCLYEWTDYWYHQPGVDRLRIGDTWIEPVVDGLFPLRFENRLGLAMLQAYAERRPVGSAATVEVISPKFPTPHEHVHFLSGLLDDLHARAARLSFSFSGATARGATLSAAAPTPLFTLHFLCHYGAHLESALTAILAHPHRQLCDDPQWVPLAEASEADAEVLTQVLHHPEMLQRTRHVAVARQLHGYAPERVWQRLPAETYDTPENRFVLGFLISLVQASSPLRRQTWWPRVAPERRTLLTRITARMAEAVTHFESLGVRPVQAIPAQSQVLARRAGYRDLHELWDLFRRARRPLFAALQHALELRDIARLYEMWTFFRLTESIAKAVGGPATIELDLRDSTGLGYRTTARFGAAGTLVYNQPAPSYSTPLRPDFGWLVGGRLVVAFDAKFRMERLLLPAADVGESDQDTPAARARRSDIYKMHAYRDALDARAAVAIYPGVESVFYSADRSQPSALPLPALLRGDLQGIGALGMTPDGTMLRSDNSQ